MTLATSRAGVVRRNLPAAGWLIWAAAPVTAGSYLVVTVLSSCLPVAVSWLTKLVLDAVTGPARGGTTALAVALAAAGTVTVGLPQLSAYLTAQLGRVVGMRAVERLFESTRRFVGIRPFETPAFLDRLRLAQQSTMTAGQLSDSAFGIVRGLLGVSGFVGSLLIVNPVLAVAVLAAGVPALLAELSTARDRADLLWRLSPVQRREFFYANLLGSIGAATEIRLFDLHSFLLNRMLGERRAANTAQRDLDRRTLRRQAGPALVGAAVAGAGLVWAVSAARRGDLTVGDVSMFVTAVAGTQAALSTTVRSVTGMHRQLLMLDHFTAVTAAEPDLPVATRPAPVPVLRGGIEFRDVWFRYGADQPWVLRGIDLVLPAGSAVGLVGLNGAGKSTVVKLLCRLYDPTHGEIRWDGVDLRAFAPAELRRRISGVFQDFMRYDLTAAENIGIGDLPSWKSSTVDFMVRIRGAAADAGVHGTLSALPAGYETHLSRLFDASTAGAQLSGGQWQRVAMARAFMRERPDLMILDEPSAGLDPVAEHDMHHRLRHRRAGLTSLLISHRLNTVRAADRIVVLDGGVVVEEGDHDGLMARDGGYARLFRMQAEGYRTGPVPTW